MDQSDLAIFRQVARWLEDYSGYPTVSGFEEFTYEPEKPIHGDLTDYAYHQRGCISYVVELWDLFARVGFERKKPFVDSYTDLTRADLVALGHWDRDHNIGRIVRPWKTWDHPQLGPVELGGVDQRGEVACVGRDHHLLGELPWARCVGGQLHDLRGRQLSGHR